LGTSEYVDRGEGEGSRGGEADAPPLLTMESLEAMSTDDFCVAVIEAFEAFIRD
jgi:hypothetical protein